MTTDDFGTVDIDLLADYIGGALDGPELAEVERLIATDPQWQETYELLVPGMVAAGAELSALGATAEAMPADVASRIDAALTSPVAAANTIDSSLAAPIEPHLTPTPAAAPPVERHLSLVREKPEPGETAKLAPDEGVEPAPRSRRRLRWAAPIAAAAAVVAFAAFGASQMTGSQMNSSDSTAAGSAPDAPAPMLGTQEGAQRYSGGTASLPPDDRILATGTNYTGAQLQESTASSSKSAEQDMRAFTSEAPVPLLAADPELAALQRLYDPSALLVCLEAIADQIGGPIEVQSVDYARFQGAPAVVVRYVFDGEQKGWAVGAECGTPGAGADRL